MQPEVPARLLTDTTSPFLFVILLAIEEWNQEEDSVLAELLQKWHYTKQQKKAAARNRKCRQRRIGCRVFEKARHDDLS